MAAGVLVTVASSGKEMPIRLLRRPIVATGRIEDGFASAAAPPWFPFYESVFATEEGEIYSRVKELALPSKATKEERGLQCVFDLRALGSRLRSSTFTLTYSPWFRFAVDPIQFDIEDSVADHVAECIRFLLVREGAGARIDASHEGCTLHCDNGMVIHVEGQEELQRIAIAVDGAETVLDFEANSLAIHRRMFPVAFAMGQDLLATGDRLANMRVEESGDCLHMQWLREAA